MPYGVLSGFMVYDDFAFEVSRLLSVMQMTYIDQRSFNGPSGVLPAFLLAADSAYA